MNCGSLRRSSDEEAGELSEKRYREIEGKVREEEETMETCWTGSVGRKRECEQSSSASSSLRLFTSKQDYQLHDDDGSNLTTATDNSRRRQ